MKGRIFLVVLLVVAAAVAGRWVTKWRTPHVSKQEETRQTGRLDAGARVEVRGINGSVEVNTADTDTADVRVVRPAGFPTPSATSSQPARTPTTSNTTRSSSS